MFRMLESLPYDLRGRRPNSRWRLRLLSVQGLPWSLYIFWSLTLCPLHVLNYTLFSTLSLSDYLLPSWAVVTFTDWQIYFIFLKNKLWPCNCVSKCFNNNSGLAKYNSVLACGPIVVWQRWAAAWGNRLSVNIYPDHIMLYFYELKKKWKPLCMPSLPRLPHSCI